MKYCYACDEFLPLDSFSLNKSRAGGRASQCKGCNRRTQLLVKYRLTPERYEMILAGQGNECAVCPARPYDFDKAFHVDHDHSCCPGGKSCGRCIRGILCPNCNLILGHAKDDPERLIALAEYLQK